MACVYQHRKRKTGEVFYIGYASESQKNYRPYTEDGRNNFWERVTRIYTYDVEIVIDNISDKEALSWERYLISLHGRRSKKEGHLVNLTDGGEGVLGIKHSEESRRRMSEAKKALLADKTKHPLYGKRGADNPQYGRKRSDSFRKNQSKDKMGDKNPMYGRRGGLCPNSKRVTNGVREWSSLKEACLDLNVPYSSGLKMILGQRTNKHNLRYL
jgi:hypothetical protein